MPVCMFGLCGRGRVLHACEACQHASCDRCGAAESLKWFGWCWSIVWCALWQCIPHERRCQASCVRVLSGCVRAPFSMYPGRSAVSDPREARPWPGSSGAYADGCRRAGWAHGTRRGEGSRGRCAYARCEDKAASRLGLALTHTPSPIKGESVPLRWPGSWTWWYSNLEAEFLVFLHSRPAFSGHLHFS